MVKRLDRRSIEAEYLVPEEINFVETPAVRDVDNNRVNWWLLKD